MIPCPTCGENLLHCKCPTKNVDLQLADALQESNTGYKPSVPPFMSPENTSPNKMQRPKEPVRATTYQTVAQGPCPCCGHPKADLRFCYNPYGDDDLICTDCAKAQDDSFNEHSGNNR